MVETTVYSIIFETWTLIHIIDKSSHISLINSHSYLRLRCYMYRIKITCISFTKRRPLMLQIKLTISTELMDYKIDSGTIT